jgi:hypothetical protein
MNGIFFSTVNDPYEIFPSQLLPLLQDISKQRPAVTDTTLSLALKQFDAQNDKIIYLRYLWCFQDR